jgi:prophage tail gpP-like protein
MPPQLRIEVTDRDDPSKVHAVDKWISYRVTNDLFRGTSDFTAALTATKKNRELFGPGGQTVRVYSHGALQITGIIDERSEDTSTTSTDLHVSGRCGGGLLIDAGVDISKLSVANLTLEAIAQRLTEDYQPTWITSVVTNAAASRYISAGVAKSYTTKARRVKKPDGSYKTVPGRRVSKGLGSKFGKRSPSYRGVDQDRLNQVKIEPGEKIMDVLQRLAAQVAAHVWVGADGALIVSRPCYEHDWRSYGDPGIQLLWDDTARKGAGGTVAGVAIESTVASRHSEYQIFAESKSNKGVKASDVIKHSATFKDPGQAFWKRQSTPPYLTTAKLRKPNIIRVKRLTDPALIRRLARSMVEDSVIKAISIDYELNGHHAPSGALWVIDSMVWVTDQRNNLDSPFYIVRVDRKYDMQNGATTQLRLVPPSIWLYHDHDALSDDAWTKHMVNNVWW